MKVYTKTGDDGTTGLFFAGRVPKDHPGPAAYGAVDEAVAGLGLARAETAPGEELHDLLVRLQRELFVVLLANRTYSEGSQARILQVRARVADLAAKSITDVPIRPRPGSPAAIADSPVSNSTSSKVVPSRSAASGTFAHSSRTRSSSRCCSA